MNTNSKSLAAIERGECPHCRCDDVITKSVHMAGEPEVMQQCESCNEHWTVNYSAVSVDLD